MRFRDIVRQIVAWMPVIGLMMVIAAKPFLYGWWLRGTYYFLAFAVPLDYIVNRRWEHWHWEPRKWVYAAFVLFALLIPVWQLFDPLRTSVFSFSINCAASFFVVGLCGLMGMSDKMRVDYFAWVMLLVSAVLVFVPVHWCGMDDTTEYTWQELFNIHRVELLNTHMVIDLYWNLSLVFGLYLLVKGCYAWYWKVIVGLLMTPPLFGLLMSDGRVGLITTVLLVLTTFVYFAVQTKSKWVYALLVAGCIGSVFFLSQNEHIHRALTTPNPRIYQWRIASRMIAERPITGYGVCSARDEYVKRELADETLQNIYIKPIVEKGPRYRSDDGVVHYESLHPHSAFLESWMRFGLLGFLLFTACLVLPFTMKLGDYQFYLNLCVTVYALQACFESLGNNCHPLFLCLPVLIFDTCYRIKSS